MHSAHLQHMPPCRIDLGFDQLGLEALDSIGDYCAFLAVLLV
jgi:hypothetical protein